MVAFEEGIEARAECWLAFRTRLDPLLERYHGHTTHGGRRPAAASGTATVRRAARRRAATSLRDELKAALAKAVAAEQYEEAARLRDQLAVLASGDSATGGSASPAESP